MNPKVKQKWVEALRSGKYKQTRGVLRRRGGSYCCLGVLCEIAREEGIVDRRWESRYKEYVYFNPVFPPDSNSCDLPEAVVRWSGLDSSDPEVDIPRGIDKQTLASLNDELKYSFSKIADVIEQQF